MKMPTEKLDITNRVFGKLQQGQMILYVGETKIGQYNGVNNMNLEPGYEYQGDHFFQEIESDRRPNEQYVDCDEGWC